MINRLLGSFEAISKRLVWLGGIMLIGAAFLVTIDVFARKFLNISLAGSDELSGYAFGMSTSLAFAYALLSRANIRVDAFYHLFPRWGRVASDIIGLALLLGFIGLIAYLGFNLLTDSFFHGSRSITPLRTPLAIPQTVWWLGLAFALLTGLLILVASLHAVFRKDWATIQRLVGVKSVDEQIDEETA
ncbi:TRAP transporter small permease subunit [Sneathiella chungangensis]|uniref:TRAP transporter small permease protein n=1 Tax=Sneathiella chungangensis TaxID=1418234 RepID=A0A845MCY5_9PROT|nr:TRAP transporter small permease [Sneathiella chungangensis]MZR21057.1 TRAP transporter small permease subunit [Sneathiella chungangensis]